MSIELVARAESNRERLAIVDPEKTATYADLLAASSHVACRLLGAASDLGISDLRSILTRLNIGDLKVNFFSIKTKCEDFLDHHGVKVKGYSIVIFDTVCAGEHDLRFQDRSFACR